MKCAGVSVESGVERGENEDSSQKRSLNVVLTRDKSLSGRSTPVSDTVGKILVLVPVFKSGSMVLQKVQRVLAADEWC